jgi:multidrug transporter EmrE-like cation transporter
VLLVPIGLLYFGERLSAGNLAGLLLCVAGLFLLVQR